MSFREAEDADAALTGVAQILRAALAEPGYARNPHQVFDNMDADPLIPALPQARRPASRAELLGHVQGHGDAPATVRDEAARFCQEHLQEGPVVPAFAGQTLGRVQAITSLAKALGASSGLRDSAAEALVRDALAAGGDSATRLAHQRREFAGKPLSRFQVWCYPASDPADPFREIGTTRAEAVDALGLGYYAHQEPDAELVRWAHTPPDSIPVRLPTAWDAGATVGNVHWRPGGKTYRLGRDETGLREVVHAPIRGEHLTSPIEVLP